MTERPVELAPRAVGERPLSRTQLQIWTSQRLAADAPLANMGTIHRIAGAVDPDRLVEAVDLVVRASDALRTVVADRPGEPPRARVLADPPGRTSVITLAVAALDDWCRDRIASPIDVTACGYDSVLLRHADDDWTWWLDLHHVITDAFSSALVFEVVADVYTDLAADDGRRPRSLDRLVGFHDHLDAVARSGDDAAIARRAAYWSGISTGGSPITPYGPRGDRTTRVRRRAVDAAPLAEFDDRYRTLSHDLSTLCILAATIAVTLHRLDGRATLDLGIPLHHRSGPTAPHVIGPLMELYPLRIEIDPADSFASLFARVHRDVLGMLRHAKPNESPDATFDAIVNVLTVRYGNFAGLPTAARWARSEHVESAHPIRVQAYDYGDGLRLELDLNEGVSDDGSHGALPDHLSRTLEVAMREPDCGIGEFDLVTSRELAIVDELNPPRKAVPIERPVHLFIADRLRAAPDRVVAEHDGAELTGGELDRRADDLARWLTEHDVGRGTMVGVRMHRGLDVLVAVHGILRAGAAFVMLDPDDPPARHDLIADEADLEMILDEIPALATLASSGAFRPPEIDPDDIAYVLFTSGSTGAPKGVPIPHRGLADYLSGAAEAYATNATIVMPLHSSLVFDLSITSLFLPQLTGGLTVVVGGDPVTALSQIAGDPRLNVIKATPSQLELLTRMITDPLGLEVVIVGGEAFRRPLAEAVARGCRRGVRIYNEYGPTEAVVGCMIHEWTPERDLGPDVPIGRASPGAEVYVLDRYQRRTPVGAWGELYVRRTGMASGYLHLPELTAELFTVVAAIGGGPLYRTGDRVRVERDVLVYGGRIDDQMKFNGVRLEPGEIESALVRHPGVTSAIVRVWSPGTTRIRRCVRCGLGSDVPDVAIDDTGVCSVCRDFDRIEPQTRTWFKSPTDLDSVRERARRHTTGAFDCLHLLSGGKDSTYALYQLIERGWRVHALTLDNGYISDGAKANIRRTIADLGISHEFVTTDAMNAIFRDSLDRFANVCNGCYKTIYTLAVARAHELGIPVIVTGLSRGQFFETRLVPHQFDAGRFDHEAIDHTVLQARRAYHRTTDAVTALLPEQAIFERHDLDVLGEIEFVDFYRYVDVELAEMYDFLETRAPWVRPTDTGRSTNCLVNVVGIHVHRTERGFHNYAAPYSWDVRLGHKTRDEALDELDDVIEEAEVARMLAEIGYEPKRPEILTAWYQTIDGREIDARLLASHLRELLPARSVPAAFVPVDDVPLAGSTKLDVSSLPAPSRTHTGSAAYAPPTTPTEAACADIWASVLDVDRVGIDDDFFDLGGASLVALETVAAAERRFGIGLPDALVFEHRILRGFAAAVDVAKLGGSSVDAIPTLDEARPVPLSPGEEAMLFEYRAAPQDTRYNVTRLYTIDADVDVDRLRVAFESVVDRHQTLHTAFDEQRTRLSLTEALSFEALPPGSPGDFADAQRRVPFDLDTGPLVRVHVGETAPGVWHVLVGMHHIVTDAGAFDVFWNDVDHGYHLRPLPELETTYAAHRAWQRARAGASADFWADWIERDRPRVATPLPSPRAPEPDGYLEVAAPVTTLELADAATTTPFAASLAAAAVVLGSYRRDDDVELAITASTKDHPASEPLVGYYLNTLPILISARGDDTLRDVDVEAGRLVAEVLPHRSYPFADIVRAARERALPIPDATSMLAYERLTPVRFGNDDADHRILASGTAVTDLTFFVHERGDRLRLGIEYRGSKIGASTAHNLLDAFGRALDTICRRPHLTVDEVRATMAGDDLVGPPLVAVPPTVLDRVLEHAGASPDRPALIDASGGTTSYAELVARASALADHIRSAHGRPRRIGVAVGRSRALVEAIIGVQLSGAAYVPIDPATPSVRRDAIVALADLDAVIVDASTAPLFSRTPQIGLAALDGPVDHVPDIPSAGDPAYVVFTSGSTGEPAGVVVSHANLAASTAARSVFYGEAPPERFLLTPSIGFDSSMVGLFWPLSTGGAVVIPGDDDVHDVDRLASVISERSVTHVLMVPSLYRALLSRRPALLDRLRTAIVAGEACPSSLVDDHHRHLPGTELVNEYGPTEATVWATAHRCRVDDDPVPIGMPVAGTTVRVADARQRPVAAGAAGELLISGPGVVAGYLSGRSDDPFVQETERRWYRTGDLARVDDRGRLLFLGRVDDQLNVNGVRLEPTEVETHLTALPGIADAVVVRARVDDRDSLVAHVTGDAARADIATIRSHLTERLGPGAVPRHIVFHDHLPRTVNGKVDRRAAEQLQVSSVTHEHDETDALLDIWRAALARPDLASGDDFFAAGGDSIAAVEIVTAVGELLGRQIPIAELLNAPTSQAMAARFGVEDGYRTGGADVRLVTMRTGADTGPTVLLTPAWDDVQGYRELADAFPEDVTVHAVAVADVDGGGDSALHRVDAVVDAGLALVEQRLGREEIDGLTVLGWSIGGVVAYELGQRVASHGTPVTTIALVDTIFPGEHLHVWSNRLWKYKSMLRPGSLGIAGREFATMAQRRLQRYAAALGRRLLSWSGQPAPTPPARTPGGIPFAALDHRPAPGPAPVVLYAANTTNPARTVHRWRTVAPDLRVVPIDGRHRGYQSVMGRDRVHQIVDDLMTTIRHGTSPDERSPAEN